MVANWPHSAWLCAGSGAVLALATLTTRFRNRAAHSDELSRIDYDEAKVFVIGPEGILWHLISATLDRKRRGSAVARTGGA